MAKLVFIQVRNIDKTVSIHADKVETSGTLGSSDYKVTITRGGTKIGEFDGSAVAGWWIEE